MTIRYKLSFCLFPVYLFVMENDHLIEFQLIEIVFYHLIEIMLIT
jgi:hypothetical protein